jgi:hypothetical protein
VHRRTIICTCVGSFDKEKKRQLLPRFVTTKDVLHSHVGVRGWTETPAGFD